MVLNGRSTFNIISAIVRNSGLVSLQKSLKDFFKIAVLSLSHSKSQQIPLELQKTVDQSKCCLNPINFLENNIWYEICTELYFFRFWVFLNNLCNEFFWLLNYRHWKTFRTTFFNSIPNVDLFNKTSSFIVWSVYISIFSLKRLVGISLLRINIWQITQLV